MAFTYTKDSAGQQDPQAMQEAEALVNADNGFGVQATTTPTGVVPPHENVTKADLAPPPITVPPPEKVAKADLAPPTVVAAAPPPPPVQKQERPWVNMAGSAPDTGSLWVPDRTPHHHHAAPAVVAEPVVSPPTAEPPPFAAAPREQVVTADLPPAAPPAPAEQLPTLKELETALRQVRRAEHRYSQGLKSHHSKFQEVDIKLGSHRIALATGTVGGEMGVNLSEIDPSGTAHRSYRQALGTDGNTALADLEKDLKAGIAATKKEQKAPKHARRAAPAEIPTAFS